MIEDVRKYLAGWSIPSPETSQLQAMIDNEIRFINLHNATYQDDLDQQDSYIIALSVAYRLWSIRATYGASSRGGISVTRAGDAMMDRKIEEEYKTIFAKRFSAQVISII